MIRKGVTILLFSVFALWVLALAAALIVNAPPARQGGPVVLFVGLPHRVPPPWVDDFQRSDRSARVIALPADPAKLSRALENEGLIHWAWAFRWLGDFRNLPSRLAPGFYRIGPSTGLYDLVETLCSGRPHTALFAGPGSPLAVVAAEGARGGLRGDLRLALRDAAAVALPASWGTAPAFYPGLYVFDPRRHDARGLAAEAVVRSRQAWASLLTDETSQAAMTKTFWERALRREGASGQNISSGDVVGPRWRSAF